MNARTHHLNFLLVASMLGACALPDELDELAPEQTLDDDDDAVTTNPAVDSIGSGQSAEPRVLVDGLDPAAVAAGMPIIAIVGDWVDGCEFTGMPVTWHAEPLFRSSPWIKAATDAVPLPATSPLRYYCKYEYQGLGPLDLEYIDFMNIMADAPPGEIDRDTAATDAPTVLPLSVLDVDETRAAALSAYLDGVEAPTGAQLSGLSLFKTHVYLLDTAQQGQVASDPHGDWLRNLMIDISCADGRSGCAGSFHSVMIMPRSDADNFQSPNWYGGGNKGLIHETSLGIAYAVQDWIRRNDPDDPTTLDRGIINISAGAVETGSYATSRDKAPGMSLIAAAQMAACMGIPIYAAAGNGARWCDSGTGLMLPAGLDDIEQPSLADCQAWGYEPWWNTSSYAVHGGTTIDDAPGLVVAVSGVDHGDIPIDNQRRNARTRLEASAADGANSVDDVTRTGTSLAAMAASVGHQLAWSLDPRPSPGAVTTKLYDSGWSTGASADAGRFVGDATSRLSICGVLASIDPGLNCAAQAPDPTASDPFAEQTLLIEAAAMLSGDVVEAEHDGNLFEPVCNAPVDLDFMSPTPTKPVCANCSVGLGTGAVGEDTLYLSIASGATPVGFDVTAAFLHLTDENRNTQTIELDATVVDSINLEDPTLLIELTFEAPTTEAATLEFEYTEEGAPANVSYESNVLWVWNVAS